SLQPGTRLADAPPDLEYRGGARRQRRTRRRLELRPRGAGRSGLARAQLVGRPRDPPVTPCGRSAQDVPEDGRARERRRTAPEPRVPDLSRAAGQAAASEIPSDSSPGVTREVKSPMRWRFLTSEVWRSRRKNFRKAVSAPPAARSRRSCLISAMS